MPKTKITTLLRIYQFFKLLRSTNLIIILATHYFSAFFLIQNTSSLDVVKDINIHLLGIIAVLCAASGYIINDYFDIKIDWINKPKEVIIGKYISRRWALFWHYLFAITSIILSLVISLKITAIVAVILFLLWIYAIKLKRTALLGNILVASLTAMVIALIAVYFREYNTRIILFIAFAFTSNLIREIIKDLEDVKGDKAEGCKTLPVTIGNKNTKWIIAILIFLFLAEIITFGVISSSLRILILCAGFALFLLVFSIKLIKADNKEHFHELSTWSKWMMLGGIMLMAV